MNRRAQGMAAAVLLLLVANVWHWSTGRAATPSRPAARPMPALRPDDLVLSVALQAAKLEPMRRDPFAAPAAAAPVEPEPEPPPQAPLPPEEPPPKTAEEVARETAQRELSELRLVGIVFREGRGQAYLVRSDEVFLVAAGDRLGERFRVEKISSDHVELRDPDTQVSGRVSVNGEQAP